jgi:hypothetical protein
MSNDSKRPVLVLLTSHRVSTLGVALLAACCLGCRQWVAAKAQQPLGRNALSVQMVGQATGSRNA